MHISVINSKLLGFFPNYADDLMVQIKYSFRFFLTVPPFIPPNVNFLFAQQHYSKMEQNINLVRIIWEHSSIYVIKHKCKKNRVQTENNTVHKYDEI